jgi:hypothetical protein
MDYKIILLVLAFIVVLFFLYNKLNNISDDIISFNKTIIEHNETSNKILYKKIQTDLDSYIDKIKAINNESIQQFRKITLLNNQPITKIINHFSESESELGTDIKYLSDSKYSKPEAKNTVHKIASDNSYYMSEDLKNKDNNLSNNVSATNKSSTHIKSSSGSDTSINESQNIKSESETIKAVIEDSEQLLAKIIKMGYLSDDSQNVKSPKANDDISNFIQRANSESLNDDENSQAVGNLYIGSQNTLQINQNNDAINTQIIGVNDNANKEKSETPENNQNSENDEESYSSQDDEESAENSDASEDNEESAENAEESVASEDDEKSGEESNGEEYVASEDDEKSAEDGEESNGEDSENNANNDELVYDESSDSEDKNNTTNECLQAQSDKHSNEEQKNDIDIKSTSEAHHIDSESDVIEINVIKILDDLKQSTVNKSIPDKMLEAIAPKLDNDVEDNDDYNSLMDTITIGSLKHQQKPKSVLSLGSTSNSTIAGGLLLCDEYTVDELKKIAKEYNIVISSKENGKWKVLKKTDIYDKIKNHLGKKSQ